MGLGKTQLDANGCDMYFSPPQGPSPAANLHTPQSLFCNIHSAASSRRPAGGRTPWVGFSDWLCAFFFIAWWPLSVIYFLDTKYKADIDVEGRETVRKINSPIILSCPDLIPPCELYYVLEFHWVLYLHPPLPFLQLLLPPLYSSFKHLFMYL